MRALPSLLFAAFLAVPVGFALQPGPTPLSVNGPFGPELGLAASLVDANHVKELRNYPVTDLDGNSLGVAGWRVVKGTGNCCENYLATTSTGRILDLGGSFLRFSDDRGLTWKQVRPAELIGAEEGAVAVAPNGDVLGVNWALFTGDRVQAIKYNAAENKWYSMVVALHAPAFDRPWLGILPGPVTVGTQTLPYVALMRNSNAAGPTYVSLDGLNYVYVDLRTVDSVVNFPVAAWLDVPHRATADWVQPVSSTLLAPIAEGSLTRNIPFLNGVPTCPWLISLPNLQWACHSFPDGTSLPAGTLRTDSLGRLHHVTTVGPSFHYRFSADGGRTWDLRTYPLPSGMSLEDWDLKVNGALDLAVLAVHAHKNAPNVDQDLAYKIENVGLANPTVRIYYLGNGDLNLGSAFSLQGGPRFDFMTLGLLPDGKIATSLADSAHREPALVIEL